MPYTLNGEKFQLHIYNFNKHPKMQILKKKIPGLSLKIDQHPFNILGYLYILLFFIFNENFLCIFFYQLPASII